MTRVKAEDSFKEIKETRKVLIPKAIDDSGNINADIMPVEKLAMKAAENKIAHTGDFVMKLSSPYDCGIVSDEIDGAIVPSFCAILRIKESVTSSELMPAYLLAFMNSRLCKSQLEKQVQGATMSILSVGKIKEVEIPVPSIQDQNNIGSKYMKAQKKIYLMKRLIDLEKMKNDALFRELKD